MITLSERLCAGLGAILSIGGIGGGAYLVDSPGWQLITQSIAMLVGLVSIIWMISQIVKMVKKKK